MMHVILILVAVLSAIGVVFVSYSLNPRGFSIFPVNRIERREKFKRDMDTTLDNMRKRQARMWPHTHKDDGEKNDSEKDREKK